VLRHELERDVQASPKRRKDIMKRFALGAVLGALLIGMVPVAAASFNWPLFVHTTNGKISALQRDVQLLKGQVATLKRARPPTGTPTAGAQGTTGPQGSTGPQGAKGDKGDTGPIGPAGTAANYSADITALQNRDTALETRTTNLESRATKLEGWKNCFTGKSQPFTQYGYSYMDGFHAAGSYETTFYDYYTGKNVSPNFGYTNVADFTRNTSDLPYAEYMPLVSPGCGGTFNP
jgi:hypothetical protein